MLPDIPLLTLGALFHKANLPVDFLWDEANAYISHCQFYTSLTASTDDEFNSAARKFVDELEEWWTQFTSWVSILTSQDFVQLGGHGPGIIFTKSWEVETWTADADGQRAREETLGYSMPDWTKKTPLEPHDIQACVTATGNQGAPPTEWLLIRDARSLLNGGQNRRAVIEAATAAELAMTALIDKYLEDANALEPVRQALARSSQNLGGKKTVLNLLRPGLLHNRVQEDLINKRNGASHRGEQYDEKETQAAVDIATAIVESAYPLASLLPTPGESPAPHSA